MIGFLNKDVINIIDCMPINVDRLWQKLLPMLTAEFNNIKKGYV